MLQFLCIRNTFRLNLAGGKPGCSAFVNLFDNVRKTIIIYMTPVSMATLIKVDENRHN
jgi:hypothetical protein